jgi:hypothetical protein
MTLPASGAISLNDVNVELGISGTTTITMNDSVVRTLFGVASGAIDMNTGYGKASRYGTVVTWPTNLTGGSTAVRTTTAPWTSSEGTLLPAGGSISFQINIVSPLPFGLPTGGAYLDMYLTLATFIGWNADGTVNNSYNLSYPNWYSRQAGTGYYLGGPGNLRQNSVLAISNIIYNTALLNTKGAYGGNYDIRMSTNLAPGQIFNGGFNSTQQTLTFTNYTTTDYWVGSYACANGHYSPFYLAYQSQSNGYQFPNSSFDNVGQTIYGRYLVSALTINGRAVSYTAPNGATQSQVIAGFKAAINAAGISGVSAVDQTNGLGIIGATSVTSSASSTVGSSNYTPSISAYGLF